MVIKYKKENFIVAIILILFVFWILSVLTSISLLFFACAPLVFIFITTFVKQIYFGDREILIEKYFNFWNKIIPYSQIQKITIKQEGYGQYRGKIIRVFYVRNNRSRVFKMKTNSEDELLELKKFFKKLITN